MSECVFAGTRYKLSKYLGVELPSLPLNCEFPLSAGCTRKTRIIDVVYNASNNELVRTKTLVKNCIVLIDSTPYRQWYESHYALPLGRKKGAKLVSCFAAGGRGGGLPSCDENTVQFCY